ncbi:MAG: hypothetical protein JWR25_2239 [Noviherbaspirillum sp.]|jgi:hypothetical protein|nr:hypothetical protein [Noviherbaspirillum sp.]
MGRTTEFRRELKRTFLPFMTAKGFVLDQRHAPHFMDFRRTLADRMQFLEIQWEKYGRPRFKVSVGQVSARGTISHGEHIDAKDVGPGQAPQYCCLYPQGDGSSTRHWFRQDRSFLAALIHRDSLHPPEMPVGQLLELFGEVEEYWLSGKIGKHLRLISNSWAKDAI